ncbi:MAG: hypothetical protein HGA31_02155 [Candidatus Moranbacteria bacterium]|nr:hypothetical protein [Candidatus Moranbacteria bacterium]
MQDTSSEKPEGRRGFISLLKELASRYPQFLEQLRNGEDVSVEVEDREKIESLKRMNPQYGICPPSVMYHNSLYDLPTQTVVNVGRIPENPGGLEEYIVKDKKMVHLKQLFTGTDEIFIGFGVPNVFTVMSGKNGYEKLDAFMYYRKKAQVAKADQVQSGIYIRLRDTSPKMLSDLRESMKKIVGKRGISCAKSNVDLLNGAGFTSGGKKLEEMSPYSLFRRIVVQGLEHEGENVRFDILNTTSYPLEHHFDSVNRKVLASPVRVVGKSCGGDEKGMSGQDIANVKKVLKAEPKPPAPAFEEDLTHTAMYRSSRPSTFGALVRKLTGVQHILHEIVPASADLRVDDYLPKNLPDKYHREGEKVKGVANRAKSVAFSKPMVGFLRNHLAMEFDKEEEFTAKQLLDMLPLDADGKTMLKQNIVICGSNSKRGSRVVITPIHVGNDLADWIMTKHLILSGYEKEVRFAGEGWGERCDAGGTVKFKIHINGESGSYTPANEDVKQAAAFLQALLGDKVEVIAHFRP